MTQQRKEKEKKKYALQTPKIKERRKINPPQNVGKVHRSRYAGAWSRGESESESENEGRGLYSRARLV